MMMSCFDIGRACRGLATVTCCSKKELRYKTALIEQSCKLGGLDRHVQRAATNRSIALNESSRRSLDSERRLNKRVILIFVNGLRSESV